MPFVEQIVEYAKTSDKCGVIVDFLGIMSNSIFHLNDEFVDYLKTFWQLTKRQRTKLQFYFLKSVYRYVK